MHTLHFASHPSIIGMMNVQTWIEAISDVPSFSCHSIGAHYIVFWRRKKNIFLNCPNAKKWRRKTYESRFTAPDTTYLFIFVASSNSFWHIFRHRRPFGRSVCVASLCVINGNGEKIILFYFSPTTMFCVRTLRKHIADNHNTHRFYLLPPSPCGALVLVWVGDKGSQSLYLCIRIGSRVCVCATRFTKLTMK